MTLLQLNGIGMHVEILEPVATPRDSGSPAPTAVLLHGMGSDTLASWYFTLAKPLHENGMRVVMYDLRGHGYSERPLTGYRLDDFVADLRALLDYAGIAEPVYLLGNSFGGTVAFTFAVRYPGRVAGIVAVESAPPTEGWMARVVARLRLTAETFARAATAPPPANQTEATGTADQGANLARRTKAAAELLSSTSLVPDLAASELPTRTEISAVACPVLCVYGGDSGVAGVAPVVRQLIPHARTVVVPGHRHTVLVDAAATVRRLVLSWLGWTGADPWPEPLWMGVPVDGSAGAGWPVGGEEIPVVDGEPASVGPAASGRPSPHL